VWLLDWILGLVWPNGILIKGNAVSMDEKTIEEELFKLHRSNLNGLMSKLPAALLSNSFGDGQVLPPTD
jgi:hypothetical protein